jgi:hypothetical protein
MRRRRSVPDWRKRQLADRQVESEQFHAALVGLEGADVDAEYEKTRRIRWGVFGRDDKTFCLACAPRHAGPGAFRTLVEPDTLCGHCGQPIGKESVA